MEVQQAQQIKRYISIVIRRKGLIATCFLLGITVGLAYYLLQPKVYQSTALLSYQQQKINPAKMSPDAEAQIRDIVSTISQIVSSRSSLERIINDYGLYKEHIRSLPMEDVVEQMREKIQITPSKQGDTFRISFSGRDPEKVVKVTNTLAGRFIEENMKYREERASETSAYTEDELEMAKEVLDRKETVMRDYKLKYYNEMPEQRANNTARLISLQEHYQKQQDSIQELERTRVLVQDQITARKELLSENAQLRHTTQMDKDIAASPGRNDRDLLKQLRMQLQFLEGKYTDQHPDIKLLKKRIANIENMQSQGVVTNRGTDSSAVASGEQFDQLVFDLQIQLKEIGLNIRELNKEKAELKKQIEEYEKWVAAAPVREAEWSALTREYGELKRHYDFLVAQNLQARSALNLERKQKGSQFKIEDPARVSEAPVKPDFKRIVALSLLLGLGFGGVLSLGLDMLDASFRSPAELEDALHVEVVCSVPYLPLQKEIAKQRTTTIVGICLFIVCCVALSAACVYFWQQGQIIL